MAPNIRPEVARSIAAAVKHNLISVEDWVSWALVVLEECEVAPGWLAELCTTYDRSLAVELLLLGRAECDVEDELGCVWLKHERSWLGRGMVLPSALELVDAAGRGRAYCAQLQQWDEEIASASTEACELVVPERTWFNVVSFFAPLGARVENALQIVQSSRILRRPVVVQ